jgi:hypothetical protein
MHIFDLTRILRRGCRHQAGHGESVFVSVGIRRPARRDLQTCASSLSTVVRDADTRLPCSPRSLLPVRPPDDKRSRLVFGSNKGQLQGRLSAPVACRAACHSPKREPRPNRRRAGLGGTLIGNLRIRGASRRPRCPYRRWRAAGARRAGRRHQVAQPRHGYAGEPGRSAHQGTHLEGWAHVAS